MVRRMRSRQPQADSHSPQYNVEYSLAQIQSLTLAKVEGKPAEKWALGAKQRTSANAIKTFARVKKSFA
jgi:hypothetical protein